MDVSAHSETRPTHTTLGEPVLEQELSLSCAHSQTESGGNVSLRLLEFKTHLLEAVEELHIRRDAETRFEDQISKTVLEKQELEWEKESLQHRIESVTNQHTESLTNLKKQAKLRNTEEEKGKYQVIAELKDKEINNLKEELKSMQLLKYNLEKKSSELEQKLALQSRTKDSHLSQLGEVEKRFSALSRQCAMVKQAHEKLEQDVDEAMRINKKLTSANEKQEATIVSLKKELDEVSNKLTKAKMTLVRHDKPRSPTGGEQHIQQLQQKLKLETEMNKNLREENETERAEKQEVIRSLQHTQQLLLSQTQTVRRVELELQTQRHEYKALKQEHEVMREKSKAVEDKVAQVMESYGASKTSWDKERTRFLDRIKNEQEDLRALKEAYDDLHQKHTKLSLQAKSHAQHIQEMEVRDSRQSLSVSTQPTHVDEIRGEEPLSEPVSRSELPGLCSLQHSISSQAKNPDHPEDTAAVTKLTATEATEGQKVPKQQSQTVNQPLSPPDMPSCPLTSSPEYSSLSESVNLLRNMKDKEDNTGTNESEQEEKQGNSHREEEEANIGQQREGVQGEDVKEGGSAGEKRATAMVQTTARRNRGEDSEGSAKDAETETKDRAAGAKEREKTAAHTPQTQIRVQTITEITDMTAEKSHTLQVIDFMNTEPPLDICESSGFTQSLYQKVSEKDAECKHLNNQCETGREYPSASCGQQEVSKPCRNEAQSSCGDTESLNHQSGCHFPETTREKPPTTRAGGFSAGFPEHLNQSNTSPTNNEPSAGHSDGFVSAEELGASRTQAEICNPSDVTSDMTQTDEKCDTHVSEKLAEPEQLLQSQGCSEQKDGQLRSVVTVEGEGDSSACKGGEGQSYVDTTACESGRTPMGISHLKNITMDAINLESEVETEHRKIDHIEDAADAKQTESETDLKLPLRPNQGCEQLVSGEKLLEDSAESSLPRKQTFRPLFEWGTAERRIPSSRTKSGVSRVHQLIQGSSLSEPNTTGGFPGRPPSTAIPMFLKRKLDNVPSVIMRASDLLNASSVSGPPPSQRRKQERLWEAAEETCRERTAADTDGTPHLPASASSNMGSKLSQQTTAECSRAPTLAGPSSESDWELSCSQERDDQQAAFREQISKIEQFLNAEKLRLPKRQRTEPNL
ncbi:coiled-coil domain-containing protein 73 isoform X2 [Archocentrus centrarchus]|uniref:coiled-coil domain-containing protein 73 isoform X2 n=1 Tax=Archocentrus centrarchus TaxID=63155 RepID=UPI0011E9C8CE|nr:coiled-coil domain-containing protein 73 isoform X2 [Archocentrus centrarchus]